MYNSYGQFYECSNKKREVSLELVREIGSEGLNSFWISQWSLQHWHVRYFTFFYWLLYKELTFSDNYALDMNNQ